MPFLPHYQFLQQHTYTIFIFLQKIKSKTYRFALRFYFLTGATNEKNESLFRKITGTFLSFFQKTALPLFLILLLLKHG